MNVNEELSNTDYLFLHAHRWEDLWCSLVAVLFLYYARRSDYEWCSRCH